MTAAAIAALIAATPCGSTVHLPAGRYEALTLKGKDCAAKPITVVASGVKLRQLVIQKSRGIVWRSGAFSGAMGAGKAGYAITVQDSANITIDRVGITNSQRGVVIGGSSYVEVTRNTIKGLVIDGIDIALSHHVRVAFNDIGDFNSGPDHPDAIQAWSRPTAAPTAHILIEGNRIRGRMQGIFFGNHIRAGVNDGGFDDVVVRRNVVEIHYTNGIALTDCRKCVIEDNEVSTSPTSPNWSVIIARGGSVTQARNRVAARRTTK